jgi:hypothetical protein
MDWQKGGSSDNVEVDSGNGGGGPGFGGGRMGIGGLVVLAILGWVFFKNPLALLDQGGAQSGAPVQSVPAQVDPQQKAFVSAILHSTEQTWGEIFQAKGVTYVDPKLHLFSGGVNTACGGASTAVGPFYCPGDQKVYLDVAFFQQLQDELHSSGDFARAYVIAHEVGHHVQNLLGTMAKFDAQTSRMSDRDRNAMSVRLELQADCYAGVWGFYAAKRNLLDPGDADEGLRAAAAVGDDRLQKQMQGTVVPESFTHGSSQQRMTWFKRGLDSGDIRNCDTFSAR